MSVDGVGARTRHVTSNGCDVGFSTFNTTNDVSASVESHTMSMDDEEVENGRANAIKALGIEVPNN